MTHRKPCYPLAEGWVPRHYLGLAEIAQTFDRFQEKRHKTQTILRAAVGSQASIDGMRASSSGMYNKAIHIISIISSATPDIHHHTSLYRHCMQFGTYQCITIRHNNLKDE
jgi:hypothetical protein